MATSHTAETLTTFTDLLKYEYAPAIVKTTAEKSFLLSHLQSVAGKMDANGKGFIIPLQFDNMGSAASLAEGDALPDSLPGTQTTCTITPKYHYFSVSVTGPAMQLSSGNARAFAEAWSNQIAVKTRSHRQHLNRQLNGDGNAYLCQADSSYDATAYITVDNAYGLSGFNASAVNGAKFITPNMKIDFVSSGTVRNSGGVKVVSVSTAGAFPSTSAILELNAASEITAVVDGDYVTVHNSYGHEMPGMMALIDDGTRASTFQGVTISSYPEFQSNVHYGSTKGTAEPITTNRVQVMLDDIEVDGGNVDFLYTSNAVWLTMGEAARAENQIVSYDTIKGALDTGWTALMFAGKPIYKDPYCIDELYAVDTRCIKLPEAGAPGWLEYDGSIIKQQAGVDQWNAYWAWYATAAIVASRKWCGKLTDITVSANKF